LFGAADGGEQGRQQEGQEGPEVGEDLAEVVAAGAEDNEDGVAEPALESAAGEAAVGLHVADLGLDGTAAA
jgi:hypothetical protein